MVDEEVENILLEIRERVRGRQVPPAEIASSATGNGDGESSITSNAAVETSAAEALARVESHLAATSRAWDRLPPLVSNRNGSIARFELWLKRQIKRATHWFTWEQVNFNASVHHALRDTLQALSDTEQALGNLRAETERQRTTLEQNHERLVSLAKEIEGQRTQIEAQRAHIETQRTQIEAQRAKSEAQSEAQRAQSEAQRSQLKARLSELTEELRERDARMQEEQRVCFKQLSLEATEAAVLEDRARRNTERLLDELTRRVEQIEKSDE